MERAVAYPSVEHRGTKSGRRAGTWSRPTGWRRGLGTLLLALTVNLAALPPDVVLARPAVQDERDRNIVVVLTSPRPGERVRGSVVIAGFAGDRRSVEGAGLNERDIQVWVGDASGAQTLVGFGGAGRPSPQAVATLGPQFDLAGFERVWDTCALAPGPYELIVWVSSLVVPGNRNAANVDVEVEACPPDASPTGQPAVATAPAAAPVAAPGPSTAPAPAPGSGTPSGPPSGEAGRVLLSDDFANPGSGWFNGTQAGVGSAAYEGGQYRVVQDARSSQSGLVPLPNSFFQDFQLEVDAQLTQGAGSGSYIIIAFRIENEQAYYQYAIEPTFRTIALGRAEGTWNMLINRTTATALNQGTAWNRVGVRVQGPDIILLANGQEVGRARDDRYRAGAIGIGVANDAGNRGEARFDNLVVTGLP